ncbi:hypothetical protein SCHPADRAFT_890347 [Schizopora paradoxa]|uniref:C2H2-type domain-containing protein n=1 Tax=Schizopora paradoxa TaxID=27342 RepID=A0A0H2RN87_9AGAM|nr:hypothetical protein SCHPADRAFT_890347 [Schizopora paradoxa]
MSIVIPASQLQHTVVTIRCDSARTAPQIECSFDEDAPPGLSSHSDKSASFTFSDRKSPASSPGLAPPLSLGDQTSLGSVFPRADLSIERGVDGRGHYLRMSFSPATPPVGEQHQPTQSTSVLSPLVTNVPRQGTPRQPTPRTASPRQSTPHPLGKFNGGGASAFDILSPSQMSNASIAVITRDPFSQISPETPSGFESMGFPIAGDADMMMSALETSLNGMDYSQSLDFLMSQAAADPYSTNPFFDPSMPQHFEDGSSIPPTPGLTSAASSCPSDFSSPAPSSYFDSVNSSRRSSGESVNILTNGLMLPDQPGVPSPMIPAGGFAPGFDAQLHSMMPSLQESRLLPCPHPGCKRQFKNTSTLTGHLKTHAGKGSRFTCTFPPCTEKFSRRHDQLRHEVYKHGKQCEWVCSRCGSFFSYERSLEKHVCTMDKSRRGTAPYQVAPKVEQSTEH